MSQFAQQRSLLSFSFTPSLNLLIRRNRINSFQSTKYLKLKVVAKRVSKIKQQFVAKKSQSVNDFQVQKITQLISPAYKLQTATNTEIKPKNNDVQPAKKILSSSQIWRGQTVDVSPLDGSFEALQKTAEKQKVTVLNIETIEQLIDQQQLQENEKEKNEDQNTNNRYNDLTIQNQLTKENLSNVMMENSGSIQDSEDLQSENQVVQTLKQASQIQQNSNSNIQQMNNYIETDNALDKTSTATLVEKIQEKPSVENHLIQRKFLKWTEGVDQFSSEEILNIESLRNFGKIGFGLMPCTLMQKYENGSGLSYIPQNVEHVIFRNENERFRVIFLVQGQGVSESANELDVEVLRISLSHEFKTRDDVNPEENLPTNDKISSFFETPNDNLITWNQYFGERNTEYFRFNTEKSQWRQFQAIEKRIQVDQSNGIMIRCAGGIVITLQMVKGPKTSKSQIQKIVQEQKPDDNSDDQEQEEKQSDNNEAKKEMSKTKLFCLQSEFYNKGKFYGVESRYDLFGNLYDYGFSYSVQNQNKKAR